MTRIATIAAALLALGLTAIHANESRPVAVAIRLSVDPSIASPHITPALKEETEAIWGPYGIQLDWADRDTSEGPAATVSLDVTVERQFEERQRRKLPRVLGRVVFEPGAATWRPIYVSFDAIESVLANRTRTSLSGIVPDRDLARALARVLAHEIGHVLMGVPGHDEAGLMRATFNADELGELDSKPFRLTCDSADHVRRRLSAITGYTQPDLERGSACIAVQSPQ